MIQEKDGSEVGRKRYAVVRDKAVNERKEGIDALDNLMDKVQRRRVQLQRWFESGDEIVPPPFQLEHFEAELQAEIARIRECEAALLQRFAPKPSPRTAPSPIRPRPARRN